jgi:hypothetical protein
MLRLLKGGAEARHEKPAEPLHLGRVGRAEDPLGPVAAAAAAGDRAAQRTLLVTVGPSLLRGGAKRRRRRSQSRFLTFAGN